MNYNVSGLRETAKMDKHIVGLKVYATGGRHRNHHNLQKPRKSRSVRDDLSYQSLQNVIPGEVCAVRAPRPVTKPANSNDHLRHLAKHKVSQPTCLTDLVKTLYHTRCWALLGVLVYANGGRHRNYHNSQKPHKNKTVEKQNGWAIRNTKTTRNALDLQVVAGHFEESRDANTLRHSTRLAPCGETPNNHEILTC
jgi:hypothetical protein